MSEVKASPKVLQLTRLLLYGVFLIGGGLVLLVVMEDRYFLDHKTEDENRHFRHLSLSGRLHTDVTQLRGLAQTWERVPDDEANSLRWQVHEGLMEVQQGLNLLVASSRSDAHLA